MFHPFIGKCSKCGNDERLIVVKAGYCQYCNEEIKREKKSARKAGVTKKLSEATAQLRSIVNKREPTGELGLFLQIWAERPHICEVTGTPIHRFDIRCFSHILPKSTYPSLRLERENIKLVQPEIHHQWEFGDRSGPEFKWVREKAEKLKSEENAKKRYNRFD